MQATSNLQSKRTGLSPPKTALDSKDQPKPVPESDAMAKDAIVDKTTSLEAASPQKTDASSVAKMAEETARLSLDDKDESKAEVAQVEKLGDAKIVETKEVPADSKQQPQSQKAVETESKQQVVEASKSVEDKPSDPTKPTETKKRSHEQISNVDNKDQTQAEDPKAVEKETKENASVGSKKQKVEEPVQVPSANDAQKAPADEAKPEEKPAEAISGVTSDVKTGSKSTDPSAAQAKPADHTSEKTDELEGAYFSSINAEEDQKDASGKMAAKADATAVNPSASQTEPSKEETTEKKEDAPATGV